ncbi:hypothetical protein SNUCP5_25080 [Clostridium perfringens A]
MNEKKLITLLFSLILVVALFLNLFIYISYIKVNNENKKYRINSFTRLDIDFLLSEIVV